MTDRIYDGALDLIGHTPLVRLARITGDKGAELCGKLESNNVAGSVKDRPALSMILAAEKSGELVPGSTVVEATSGNTGISLAMICAVRGYRCVIVMPEDMSAARRHLLKSYGAEVVLTAAEDGMAGAVEQAERLMKTTPGSLMCGQFENPANPDIHAKTTAEEIWAATGGKVDALVVGVGTGGTLTGVGRVLKERNPNIRIVAVEPRASSVLSGGKPGLHGIQGLGAGFIPAVLDTELVDEVITVTDLAAERMTKRLAREEGLLLGPSSGANVHAALEVSRRMQAGERVVTILCDGGERYLC
ncbi:MAG: cysteine synthase A [Deltaproteobacteria bacterium]|nr:cysteine synthase A [Deltaproteobacteria bacterium]MBW1874874.1 cysteine synthase A [Deltaproteobacteria bacterium]MBW2211025.1 cysteine synthase A [Deltaproteobacteria bacterium]MBW2213691.1 cysteine synthase A [Deltaproteobacteria bacterium]MBW2378986.1 cysteine synthase A [Deltaproteobacteria bacterium]